MAEGCRSVAILFLAVVLCVSVARADLPQTIELRTFDVRAGLSAATIRKALSSFYLNSAKDALADGWDPKLYSLSVASDTTDKTVGVKLYFPRGAFAQFDDSKARAFIKLVSKRGKFSSTLAKNFLDPFFGVPCKGLELNMYFSYGLTSKFQFQGAVGNRKKLSKAAFCNTLNEVIGSFRAAARSAGVDKTYKVILLPGSYKGSGWNVYWTIGLDSKRALKAFLSALDKQKAWKRLAAKKSVVVRAKQFNGVVTLGAAP